MGLRRRRLLLPYALLGPGLAWLVVFFAIPAFNQLYVSLQTGNFEVGYTFDWNWSTYTEALERYDEQFLRSLGYAATPRCSRSSSRSRWLLHRLQGGPVEELMLLLIVLPFFTSYLIRTVAWQTILSDNGFVLDRLRDVGIVGEDGRLLATRTAVITGITYNFLPFMALPLYVSLEKIDRQAHRGGEPTSTRPVARRSCGDAAARAAGHLRRLAADLYTRRWATRQRQLLGTRAST
jgi:spermidine/putrescine transport system permease protein